MPRTDVETLGERYARAERIGQPVVLLVRPRCPGCGGFGARTEVVDRGVREHVCGECGEPYVSVEAVVEELGASSDVAVAGVCWDRSVDVDTRELAARTLEDYRARVAAVRTAKRAGEDAPPWSGDLALLKDAARLVS